MDKFANEKCPLAMVTTLISWVPQPDKVRIDMTDISHPFKVFLCLSRLEWSSNTSRYPYIVKIVGLAYKVGIIYE